MVVSEILLGLVDVPPLCWWHQGSPQQLLSRTVLRRVSLCHSAFTDLSLQGWGWTCLERVVGLMWPQVLVLQHFKSLLQRKRKLIGKDNCTTEAYVIRKDWVRFTSFAEVDQESVAVGRRAPAVFERLLHNVSGEKGHIFHVEEWCPGRSVKAAPRSNAEKFGPSLGGRMWTCLLTGAILTVRSGSL